MGDAFIQITDAAVNYIEQLSCSLLNTKTLRHRHPELLHSTAITWEPITGKIGALIVYTLHDTLPAPLLTAAVPGASLIPSTA